MLVSKLIIFGVELFGVLIEGESPPDAHDEVEDCEAPYVIAGVVRKIFSLGVTDQNQCSSCKELVKYMNIKPSNSSFSC